MVWPSGEKNGPSWTFAVEVSRRATPPLRGTVQISSAYRKAISVSDSDGERKMCWDWDCNEEAEKATATHTKASELIRRTKTPKLRCDDSIPLRFFPVTQNHTLIASP